VLGQTFTQAFTNVANTEVLPQVVGDKFVRNIGGGNYDTADPMEVYFPTDRNRADPQAAHLEGQVLTVVKNPSGKRKYLWQESQQNWLGGILPKGGLPNSYLGYVLTLVPDGPDNVKYDWRGQAPPVGISWLKEGNVSYYPEQDFIDAYNNIYGTTNLGLFCGKKITKILQPLLYREGQAGTNTTPAQLVPNSVAKFTDLLDATGASSANKDNAVKFKLQTNTAGSPGYYRLQLAVMLEGEDLPRYILSPVIAMEAPFDCTVSPGSLDANGKPLPIANTQQDVFVTFHHDFLFNNADKKVYIQYTDNTTNELKYDDVTSVATKNGNAIKFPFNFAKVQPETSVQIVLQNLLDQWSFKKVDMYAPDASTELRVVQSAVPELMYVAGAPYMNMTPNVNFVDLPQITQTPQQVRFGFNRLLSDPHSGVIVTPNVGTVVPGSANLTEETGLTCVTFYWSVSAAQQSFWPVVGGLLDTTTPPKFTIRYWDDATQMDKTLDVVTPFMGGHIKSHGLPTTINDVKTNVQVVFPYRVDSILSVVCKRDNRTMADRNYPANWWLTLSAPTDSYPDYAIAGMSTYNALGHSTTTTADFANGESTTLTWPQWDTTGIASNYYYFIEVTCMVYGIQRTIRFTDAGLYLDVSV
jgi:hypothetical protein